MDVKAVLPDLVEDVDAALRHTLIHVHDTEFSCPPQQVENLLKIFKASLLLWQGQLELLQMRSGPGNSDWLDDQVAEVAERLQPAISLLQDKLQPLPENVVSLEAVRRGRA